MGDGLLLLYCYTNIISMVILAHYVELPEGITSIFRWFLYGFPILSHTYLVFPFVSIHFRLDSNGGSEHRNIATPATMRFLSAVLAIFFASALLTIIYGFGSLVEVVMKFTQIHHY